MNYRNIKIVLVAFVLILFFIPNIVNATEDNTPPQITALSITPSEVNTENQNQVLTLTVTLTDDQTGVSSIDSGGGHGNTQLRLRPLDGGTQFVDFTPVKVSGTHNNGVYSGTATLPRGAKNGIWVAEYILLVDKIGNYQYLDTSELELLFGASSIRITNTATVYDSTAPQVTAFSLTPSEVNTENAGKELTLTVTLTDDQAGVSSIGDEGGRGNTQLRLQPATGGTQFIDIMPQRVSGSDLNGNYSGTATLPKGAKDGIWDTTYLMVADKIGNHQNIDLSELESLFGAGSASITNTATISDSTAPQVTAFSLTPTEINTENQSQELTLNVTLTDDQAGVSSVDSEGGYGNVQLRLRPLIGTQFIDITPQRVAGSDLNGNYSGTATLPMGAKEGIWSVEYLLLDDKVGNSESLDTDELNSLLPGAEGLIIANTAEAETVTIERDWTISTAKTSVTFPANTIVTKKEGGKFAFYQMTSQEFLVEEELPEENFTGTPVGTVRLGIPGLNLSFSQSVSVSFNVGTKYDGYKLLIQSLGENDVVWANEKIVLVSNGWCTFTVNHATYFASNFIPSRPSGYIRINNNARATRSKYVTLNLRATDKYCTVVYMRFSNNGRRWSRWKRYASRYWGWDMTSRTYGGSRSKGTKYVYVQYKNKRGSISAKKRDSIIYK